MKPLLRVVLILDALLLLAFGLLFVLTPWTSLYDALQLVPTEPMLVGQAFGVALIGLAWLAVHASFDGALTSTVAKVVGHAHWLIGVLMLVWLLGLHTPSLTGFGQMVAVLAGIVLVVIGLGGVRLSGAVRRREKGIVVKPSSSKADSRANKRVANEAEKDAARQREPERDNAREPRASAGFPVYHAEPVPEPVVPVTRPVHPAAAASVGTTAPLHPAASEPGVSESERAARDTSNDVPGAPRPPFHG
ncbi:MULTISPECIES: hypothetical protein [unclassified Paraburkholderia]|uniref:hypothetical protein n=1 Tax=unclassified Paraburkholderia TaxID=2615204 RepID=UPI001620503D|nr:MULTISPECIES: hypothetical protein [unclassified Paraburkholderia]MBB5442216.1 hypothetical protein [Paraburkholderia sp. WSM4177]MBB5482975.1 hypothetical protein [Paraburkholderia sp. WSM4180]